MKTPAALAEGQALAQVRHVEEPWSWKERLADLCHYMDTQQVSRSRMLYDWLPTEPEHELADWLREQRALLLEGRLSPERERLLRALHLLPTVKGRAPVAAPDLPERKMRQPPDWETRYAQLAAYKAEHGHCNVPFEWPAIPGLGRWVAMQRRMQFTERLRRPHEERLEALGFQWQMKEAEEVWAEHFQQLLDHRREHGHLNVLRADNRKLWIWMNRQRELYHSGGLSQVLRERLEAIDFPWKVIHPLSKAAVPGAARSWEKMCALLEEQVAQEGPGCIEALCKQTTALGRWLWKQRRKAQAGLLLEEWRERLETLGALAKLKAPMLEPHWQKHYAALRAFYQEHGHVSLAPPMKPYLRAWCREQRVAYSHHELKPECVALMDELGFEWESPKTLRPKDLLRNQQAWDKHYRLLKLFHQENGHCEVPRHYHGNRGLFLWVGSQRSLQKRRQLSPEREARLVELGFRWADSLLSQYEIWETRYAELKAYHQEHGHTRVSRRENSTLCSWRYGQCEYRRAGTLSAERIAKLEELGFEWVLPKYSAHSAEHPVRSAEERRWDSFYRKLQDYHRLHDDCQVPINDPRYAKLTEWLQRQRYLLKAGQLALPQLERLAELGFQ